MSGIARVRIGRVTMKAGGADVRVLYQAPRGKIIARARELISTAEADRSDLPSAFVGVFFWRDDKEPWRPSFSLGWDTEDPNLPLARLFRVAASEIEAMGAAVKAEDRVMRKLGYVTGDEPDAAS